MISAPFDIAVVERPGPVLHMIMWDHPSATSRRLQKTECGRYVAPHEMAKDFEAVTCPACKAAIDTYEELTV